MEYANKEDIQEIINAIDEEKKKAIQAKNSLDKKTLDIETEKIKLFLDILEMIQSES